MPIQIICPCGKRLAAKDELAGRRVKCPACAGIIVVPKPVEEPQEDLYLLADEPVQKKVPVRPVVAPPAAPTRATPTPTPTVEREPVPHRGRFLYLVMGLVLVPLIVSTLIGTSTRENVFSRLADSAKAHPELKDKFQSLPEEATLGDVLAVFPGDRLDGAFLAHDTWMHWVLALLSAGLFYGATILIFPGATGRPLRMAAIGAFTATVGILLLLGFQWVAEWTQHVWRIGFGWITLLFYVVKFIGFSYRAASDPNNGFLLSCVGFTLGVGLCEEICKAMPLLYRYNSEALGSWRVACMCGLASGAGFGVSEAIQYSSHFYNGVAGADLYWIRFISCVGLHALWTGGGAIMLFKRRDLLESNSGWNFFFMVVGLLSAPIVLHGLYDTLLKKEMQSWALLVAVATFGWFCWQVETASRKFAGMEEDLAAA